MNLDIEQYRGCLSHLAFPSQETVGRKYPLSETEAELDRVNPFLRDETALLGSKALRRLGNKTQVYTDPKNPHVRHRSDHTHETVSAAVWIAACTGLNVELCRVIALGHDLGHSPYGHLGEDAISRLTGKKFKHEVFGVVVAQEIERKGLGLNLSWEVLNGMYRHSGTSVFPTELNLPLECRVGSFADKISYLFADVNDAQRLDSPAAEEAAKKAHFFGSNHRERTQTCLRALIQESAAMGGLSFSESETAQAFLEFRNWMYTEVYEQLNDLRSTLCSSLSAVYELLCRLPYFEGCDPAVLLALMTDREIDDLPTILRNKRSPKLEEIAHLGIVEIAPHIKGKQIDFTQVDLNPADFYRHSKGSLPKAERLNPPLEIERRFLVQRPPDNLSDYPHQELLQGYLEINEDGSEVRIRQEEDRYYLVKKAGNGLVRQETPPQELTLEQFEKLWQKTMAQLRKTRYHIDGLEVDVYHDELTGLVIAEREFASENASREFIPPWWLGEEVTEDKRYKNQSLARFGLP